MLSGTRQYWNLNGTTFTAFIDHCEDNWVGKNRLIVICKFLRLFLNTLTANDRYPLLDRDKLRQPIQMQLSQKLSTFSQFVSAFLKGRLNFEHFQSKDDPHSWCILKTEEFEICGEINVWKFPLKRSLPEATWYGKKTVLESESHHV